MRLKFLRCKNYFPLSIAALFCVACTAPDTSVQASAKDCGQVTVYQGASVWDGAGFAIKDVAISEGVFIDPDGVCDEATRIDVAGKFLTPPYANAHHHITNANDQSGWTFLEHGVFYVWNPNFISSASEDGAAEYYARTDTYDVRVSMGGVTEPGGHPEKLYVETLAQFVYPGMEFDDFYKNAFHYGRTSTEIDAALDLLVQQGADFVKTYLLYSEEYELRREDDAYYGLKGLNPDKMPYLVKAAHDRNLPVAVHVQTRNDVRAAVDAGVDILAHLPAYTPEDVESEAERITLGAADAKHISDAGVLSVPTYALAVYHYQRQHEEGNVDLALKDRHYAIQASNLRLLADAGAAILTGTDAATHIYDEAKHWVAIEGLTVAQALKSVYQTGPYLFPNRKIGVVAPGYEADFLILSADPSLDIENLKTIETRVKGGKIISAPTAQ